MRVMLTAAVLALCAGVPSAQAHHSRSMFDTQRTVDLVGTVRLFQWNNPHCYIQLTVGAGAQAREYSIEMGAPLHLMGRGWTPRSLRPGDEVRIALYPLRSGDNGGELASIERVDGRPIGRAG
jgi:hypothetical protein